jgi:hypothetical protein
MIRLRLTLALALLLSALLITVLPRAATAAAPVGGATSVSSSTRTVRSSRAASSASAGVCSLTGLVRADGSSCPGSGRLRRQILDIPNPLKIVKKVVGGVASTTIKAVALTLVVSWVASGAESALKQTAKVIDQTTSPQLTSSWFSSSYWRIAGIAALLTIPFLCTAAIHALVRSDLGLLTRAAFGYLPLSLLAVGIASQLTMLLLAGADEMSSIVASASGHADGVFLSTSSVAAITSSVADGDPFIAFLGAIITVAATLALWLELLVRDAAVYVIVLMLPLFFAAMVWPARRTLAIRAIETLIALILSKFAIVAVLSLGGSALGHSTIPGAANLLTGATLVLLAAFTPWALLRILPLHEVAAAAAGGLSQGPRQAVGTAADAGLRLAEGSLALGAAGGEQLGQRRLPGGAPPDGGRSRSERESAAEPEPDAGWAQPIDAEVAQPVTSAMSGSDGTRIPQPAGSGTEGGPRSGGADGGAGRASIPTSAAPVDGRGEDGSPALSGPDDAVTPRMFGRDDPPISIGDDLFAVADAQRAADAKAGEPATVSGDASAPRVRPPVLAGDDPIGARPADLRRAGPDPLAEERSTSRAPASGLDPFEGGDER